MRFWKVGAFQKRDCPRCEHPMYQTTSTVTTYKEDSFIEGLLRIPIKTKVTYHRCPQCGLEITPPEH